MLAAGVGIFLFLREKGSALTAPPPPPGAPIFEPGSQASDPHILLHILLALAVIIVVARAMGALFTRFRQPAVIGEVVAGLVLGPSLLGRVSPEVSAYVLPKTVAPFVGNIAQVGVVLFMFLVGLVLDTNLLRKWTRSWVAVSHACIVTPFVLGGLLALILYPVLATNDVPFFVFALFMGISMSVTAFPVLARILTDSKLQRTKLGVVALTCAAVDDVSAWCLLALVVSIARSHASSALITVAMSAAFVAVMLLGVRPLLARFVRARAGRGLTQGHIAVVLVGLLLSALATEAIGIHALFGAFVFGAIVPHDSDLARDVADRLTDVVVVLLLPAFFAFTGMRTQIGLVSGLEHWLLCGLIILVATAGKFGGSFVAARLTGLDTRESAALGVLMNTRGLMELIVLNIGLDLKVISPTLFTMLVIMAVVTTFATTPILHLVLGREPHKAFAPDSARETTPL
ncbi:MAG: cation:proton antiporter [Polyangiaceae bacterium]|nr:cation:proton antiporter [Polyangiaceae bacterium]